MEKTFDFDHFESRLPWGQVKWEPAELEKTFGTQDVLAAWIADMDLKTLPEVQEAIIEAAKNGMYGYTKVTDEVIASYLRWQQRRNGCGLVPFYPRCRDSHQSPAAVRDGGRR